MAEALAELGEARPRRFRPYPEYRNSGVEWLGRIPPYWDVRRIKYVAPITDERAYKPTEDFSYVGLEDIESWTGKLLTRQEPVEIESTTTIFQAGDVLFGKLRPYLAKVLCTDFAGTCSTELLVLRPREEIVPGYLAYQLVNSTFISWINSMAYGTKMPRVSPVQFASAKITIPPRSEQRTIVAFLDRETAKIDALMEKKERLVGLLQEKRTALITRTVTKGLDPNVPMKDSGVQWLNEIPAHWKVRRIKHVARLESGHTPSRQRPEYWQDCRIPWFSLADVWQIRDARREYVVETAEKISDVGLAHSAARLLPKETVILSRTASVGFSAIMGVDMATTQDFVNWVCGSRLCPEYLLYVFRTMGPEFERLTMGSTHQTIYMPDVRKLCTPVPPIDEQDRIVEFIRSETAKIDELVDKIREAIERVKEFRTALISAAVTGKIDVRDEVA